MTVDLRRYANLRIITVFQASFNRNPLAGKFSDDTRKKGTGAKSGASHDWRSFYLSQYDWLKGSHMTKVVWLPNETGYSYCKLVAPNTAYSTNQHSIHNRELFPSTLDLYPRLN